MPDFKLAGRDKPPIPRGTFVRLELSTPAGNSFPMSPTPLVGQVWDTAPGASLWVVLPDGSAVKVHPRDATVLDEADALTLL
jgi:hypothetical protein